MKIHKGFKFRIYPTAAQEKRLLAWEGALRFLWNLANEQRLMGLARTDKRYPTAFDQQKELTALRAELPWLADVPRNACSRVLTELDLGWQRAFKRLSLRRPRWKRRNVDSVAVTETKSAEWRRTGDCLVFPKIGPIRARWHTDPRGKQGRCSIVRDGDQWFVCVTCEIEAPDPPPRPEPRVAIDRGIVNLTADSDGKLCPNPRFYERTMKQLARAQRTVNRRKKGSKNREKAKLRVMRLHRKVRRQREHVIHGLSAAYAKSHGTVVVEKLNTQGMVRAGRGLARGILDSGWGKLVDRLRYKLAWSGGSLVEVPAHYSSQTCAACGAVDTRSRLSQSEFCCTACGSVDHADINAAKVLLSRANRSALPVEGEVSETTRRSRKVVKLWTPRRKPQAHHVG